MTPEGKNSSSNELLSWHNVRLEKCHLGISPTNPSKEFSASFLPFFFSVLWKKVDFIQRLWISNLELHSCILGIVHKLRLLHFVAFFHVASLFSTGVENKKVGVDNKKALELTNSTVFHRGRQWKSSRAGQQNNFFIFQPDFNVEISPKNATKHPVA